MTTTKRKPGTQAECAGSKDCGVVHRKDSDFERYSQMIFAEYSGFGAHTYIGTTTPAKFAERVRNGAFKGIAKAELSLRTFHNANQDYNQPTYNLLIGSDFDKVDAAQVRAKLLGLSYPPFLVHTTTSGDGVRAVFALSPELAHSTEEEHRRIGHALNVYIEHFDVEGLDKKCTPDPARRYYAADDPSAMLNRDFKPLDSAFMARWGKTSTKEEKPLKSQESSEEDMDDFATLCEIESLRATIKKPYEKGRSDYTMKLYFLCGYSGLNIDAVDSYVEANLTAPDFTWGEIEGTCRERYEVGKNKRLAEEQAKADRLNPDNYHVTLAQEIPDPVAVLTAPDNGLIGSEGNIVILLGKAKTRKTYLAQLLVADYIQGRNALKCGEVLFFDTEQGVSHTQKIAKRLRTLCDGELDEEGFRLYALRELMPKDRAEFIERTCREFNPKLVVIDGIVDICANFMDLEKSTETVQQLMTLSGELQCAIVGILHENKGKEDRNGRGHLGTIATQKAETVANLTVEERCDNLVRVEFTYTRNRPPQPFAFSIGDDGLPYISSYGLPKLPKDYDLWAARLPEPMGYADLRRVIMADTGKTKTTAENHISRGIDSGVIEKVGDKYQLTKIE